MIHRCDAGPKIGTGHFFRQLALAEAGKAMGREPLMLVTGLSSALAEQAEAVGIEVEASSPAPATSADARKLAERAEGRGSSAVVVDGYRFGPGYYRELGDAVEVVAAVDDLGEHEFPVDVLINVGPHASQLDYRGAGRCLLGPRYALLRRQFVSARREVDREGGPSVPRDVGRVLVIFGGGDPGRMTRSVLGALERAGYGGRVDLVLGPAAGDSAYAETNRGRGDVHVHRNVSDMVKLMRGQHLAVCAAGGTSWELACLGVPMIQTVLADNQRPIARALEEQGVTVFAGNSAEVEPDELANLFRSVSRDRALRSRMSRRGMKLVDGRGARRVLDAIDRRARGEDEL